MDCKKIREILLTDHIDRELDMRVRLEVEKHLKGCAGCAAYLAQVKKAVVEPFADAGRVAPEERLWGRIEARLYRQQENSPGWSEKLAGLAGRIFRAPAPALSYAVAVAIMLSAGTFTAVKVNSDNEKKEAREQISYLASVAGFEETSSGAPGVNEPGFGTSIEEIFL